MTDVSAWAAVDDGNLNPSPAGWPEGMMPSGVNNSARAMMGGLKRWRDQSGATVVATGTANALVITYPVAPAALAMGDTFSFYHPSANTGAATLQVNAQAAKPILNAVGAALAGGELPAGGLQIVTYDGASFRLVTAASAAAIGAAPVASLGNYLPLSGGALTGLLTTPGLTVTGNGVVNGTVTAGAVNSTGNAGVAGTVTAGNLSTAGSLTAASAAITGSTINLNGQPVLLGNTPVSGTYTILYGNDGQGGLFLGGNTSYLRQGNQYFQAQDTTNYALFMSIGTYNQSGAWGSLSDRRLKQDIEPYTRGLDAVLALSPVRFRYRPGTPFAVKGEAGEDRPSELLIGLIADEVMPHLPELVGSDGEYQTLHPGNLVYALIGACRELAARVERLEAALVK